MTPDEGNRVEIVQRTLLYAGASLSVLAVLVALMKVLSEASVRMRSTGKPFAFLCAIAASWVLSPYWGAFKERQRSGKRTAGVILIVALVVMISIQAVSFIATTFVYPGVPGHTNDGVTILLVPVAQWLVLIVVMLVRSGQQAAESRRSR